MLRRLHASAAEHDLRNAAADAAQMMTETGERAAGFARGLQDRAMAAYDGARERLSSMDAQLRRGAHDAALVTDGYVRERPWRALALGTALGVLVGAAVGAMTATAARRR